jgi:hypothetical protein
VKVYILGPMTGMPNENREVFAVAALGLRMRGFEVVSPAELNPPMPDGADPEAWWQRCMRVCIAALVTCEAVYRIEGWDWSRGGSLEAHIARGLRMKIVHASMGGYRVEVPA